MRHAFLMNCHADTAMALQSLPLYATYWRTSTLYLFLDGPAYDATEIERMSAWCTRVVRGSYEPHKSKSILNAMNALVDAAAADGVEYASFVHADMIPTSTAAFTTFLERFAASNAWMSFTPLQPGSPLIDFCNLHFHLPAMRAAKLWPIAFQPDLPADLQTCNEAHVTQFFDRTAPTWRKHTYPMAMLALPLWANTRLSLYGAHLFHNFTIESSVVHCNDPAFWNAYTHIAGFVPRPAPQIGI